MKSINHGPTHPEFRGKLREADVFGYPQWEKKLRLGVLTKDGTRDLSAQRTFRVFQGGGYIPFEESRAFVEKAYPLDPHNPAKPFAKELRLKIARALGLHTKEELSRIRLYSALNSPLDRLHGIDAYFIYDDPYAGEIVITIDETENPSKIDETSATKTDILMHGVVAEPELDKGLFTQSVAHWAEEISRIIKRKVAEHKRRYPETRH